MGIVVTKMVKQSFCLIWPHAGPQCIVTYQPMINVTTNLVVTLQPMAVTTKFVVTAVTTKLVVLAYF